jgi:hypothetical protein
MAITSTAGDLLKLALKTAGVLAAGQTMAAEDANDALTIMFGMLAQWNQNRWMIYHLLDIKCQSTGATSYTVGPGGQFNTTRPDSLESGYARLEQSASAPGAGVVDYPLSAIDTYEEYASIPLKYLQSFPAGYFYDPTLTLGTIYFYPIPNATFELHIIVKDVLESFTGLSNIITLPPEYYEAIFWSMVGRLQVMYQLPVSPAVIGLAKAALNAVAIANHRVPSLRLPDGLSRVGTRTGITNVGVITEGISSGIFQIGGTPLGP